MGSIAAKLHRSAIFQLSDKLSQKKRQKIIVKYRPEIPFAFEYLTPTLATQKCDPRMLTNHAWFVFNSDKC